MNPKVSIIMSVYNEAEEIKETIKSVLNQTFKDFEFIIINDGSIDSTRDLIKEYVVKDRIILLENEENMGLTKSLNRGINLAKGKYIARIDGRDLWNKIKLEKQINFLEKNKDYIICGTQAFYINKNGTVLGQSWFGIDNKEIRTRFFTKEGIYLHPSIVFRNTKIYYREFFRYSQDLDLYLRLSFQGKLYCLPEPLISCKISSLELSIKKKYYQRQYQNIAYNLFKERIKQGQDTLDLGKIPKIRKNKIGLKLCEFSMPFYIKYIKYKSSKKNPILWLFWLLLSLLIYPPLIADYWNKFKGIVFYGKNNFFIR